MFCQKFYWINFSSLKNSIMTTATRKINITHPLTLYAPKSKRRKNYSLIGFHVMKKKMRKEVGMATMNLSGIMTNVCYLRIWNTSKTPEESAWVRAIPANNQLQVLDSADLSGWTSGETVQVGDPTSITPNRCIALDISPMLQNVLGAVFPQKGIVCKSGFGPQTGFSQGLNISPSGAGGSFVGINSATDGSWASGLILIPCTELSPISNSNLVFVREQDTGGQMGISLISSMAVFG